MNRLLYSAALFLLFAACLAMASGSANESKNETHIRFDGVYRTSESGSSNVDIPLWYYLRFYPDGTVVGIGTPGTPEDVRDWLTPELKYAGRGKFRIKGNHISFYTTAPEGTVDYSGEICEDGLRLSAYSHINKHRTAEEFEFIEWQEGQLNP